MTTAPALLATCTNDAAQQMEAARQAAAEDLRLAQEAAARLAQLTHPQGGQQ